MILTALYLFHETVAKYLIPYYRLKFEAREAANRLFTIYKEDPKIFYNTTKKVYNDSE